MKKTMILLAVVSVLFFAVHPAAWGADSPEVRGDQVYVGDFVGFKGNNIQIDLERTGYRVSLPLADGVEFLHRDMDYAPYDPEDIFFEAPVKAIEVDGKIVQVIMLWLLPR